MDMFGLFYRVQLLYNFIIIMYYTCMFFRLRRGMGVLELCLEDAGGAQPERLKTTGLEDAGAARFRKIENHISCMFLSAN